MEFRLQDIPAVRKLNEKEAV